MQKTSAWKRYTTDQLAELEELCGNYRAFISANKTERTFVTSAIALAEQAGYVDLKRLIAEGATIGAGSKLYINTRGKALTLVHVGTQPLSQGFSIIGAHVDCPRLDIKQNPLYEKADLAYFDTHYYGGLKSMHWVATPLALVGVVVKKDGTTVDINIGDGANDPVFCISDILIHLAGEQLKKPLSEAIEHEQLDVIVGGRPLIDADADDDKGEAVRNNVLALLAERYDIQEEDFLSAELEVVPAGPAREMGLDRSMVLGFGQDDRVCSYTSLAAILAHQTSARTAVCILTDKEEIGSIGATGSESMYFENAVAEVMALAGEHGSLNVRRALARSRMLSSDVSAGYDPTFAGQFDEKNAGYMGRGFCFNKFVGSRGKGGSNDADAEYMAFLRKVMDEASVQYQTCELGKVDAGGGGTIAGMMAKYGMQVIDAGVPVLSMHALWEVTNKADIYEAYCGYKAFMDAD